jgi:hypothetical protein
MLERGTIVHVCCLVSAAIFTVAGASAGDDVTWKGGDRGVVLQDAPLMSSETRLDTIPAGTELMAETVQGNWLLVEAPTSKKKGWVVANLVGRLASDLAPVFPKDMQGKWSVKSKTAEAGEGTLCIRDSYLLWIRKADTVHLVRSTALTGVTRSGRAGTGWEFHAAQFKIPYTIGMPFPPREGAKPIIVEREASVSKEGEEIVLALDAAETTVRGNPPAIPSGASIQVTDYVTNSQGEREGVYRLSVPKDEVRFRRSTSETGKRENGK